MRILINLIWQIAELKDRVELDELIGVRTLNTSNKSYHYWGQYFNKLIIDIPMRIVFNSLTKENDLSFKLEGIDWNLIRQGGTSGKESRFLVIKSSNDLVRLELFIVSTMLMVLLVSLPLGGGLTISTFCGIERSN